MTLQQKERGTAFVVGIILMVVVVIGIRWSVYQIVAEQRSEKAFEGWTQTHMATIDISQFEVEGVSAKVPPIKINITMTDEAAEFVRLKQNCRLKLFFDGNGVPEGGRQLDPNRAVILGEHSVLLSAPGMVVIDDAKVSSIQLRRLTDANFHFRVDAVSYPAVQGGEELVGFALGQIFNKTPTELHVRTVAH